MSIEMSRERIEEFCRRWRVIELAVDRQPSKEHAHDVQMSVRFDTEADWSLTDRIQMQSELQSLSTRTIRLHHRRGLQNFKRRPAMSVLFDA